jgi:hemerythrin-like domain-containing protein
MSTTRATISVQLPGHRAPAAGYEAPFAMLHACHERVQRTLALLQRLHAHVAEHGGDAQAVQAARDVLRYFEQAAPQHHLDEERHVFAQVLALNDSALTQVVQRLQQDHLDMESSWSRVRAELHHLVEAGEQVSPVWVENTRALFQEFVHLYERHMPDEEQLVFPAAEQAFSTDALAVMAQDMMQRRGVRLG